MAVPRLTHRLPFFLLDPAILSVSPMEAIVHETADRIAGKVAIADMGPMVGLVLSASGCQPQWLPARQGGYADLGMALLVEGGLVNGRPS
jgi:5-formyltetrahydrofolate cyclo-ligase